MFGKRLTELTSLAAPTRDDLLYLINDPGGAPASRRATLESVISGPITFVAASGAPADAIKNADYVCDGTNDETEINTALALGGMVLLCGDFTLGGQLSFSADVHLLGQGCTLTLTAKDYWTDGASADHIVLENLAFDGNRVAIGALAGATEKTDGWFDSITSLRVHGCRFEHFSGTPIAVNVADVVMVENSQFIDILGHTYYGGTSDACSGGVYLRNVEYGVVSGNYFDTMDDNAVGISGSGVIVSNNRMTECRFMAACNDSPEQQMTYAVISGNQADRLYRGVMMGYNSAKPGRNIIITNNHIVTDTTVTRWTDAHATTAFDGIVTWAEVYCAVISGNIINAAARALYQSVNLEMVNIRIDGNHITHGLSNNLNLDVTDCVIENNTIVTNGVNAGQYPLQTLDCDVRNNKFIINTGLPPSFTGGTVRDNQGYITENYGAAAAVADGGTIAHGCAATPTSVQVSGSVANEFVSVTAIGAANITVAIKKHDGTPGTAQTVYWRAWV